LPLGATQRPLATGEPPLRWPASVATLPIAVVGAHLRGLPLNGQLVERGATLREATRTAERYRLFALPGTNPPKPGLLRVPDGEPGGAIDVEVWDMPQDAVGSFLALIAPPLALGCVELADGRWVHGFLCEGHPLAAAQDITAFGGWRSYLASLAQPGNRSPGNAR
jgi:allophanate hydrolase